VAQGDREPMSFRSVSLPGNRYAPGSMGFEKDINPDQSLLLCMHTLELATPNHDLREPHGPIDGTSGSRTVRPRAVDRRRAPRPRQPRNPARCGAKLPL